MQVRHIPTFIVVPSDLTYLFFPTEDRVLSLSSLVYPLTQIAEHSNYPLNQSYDGNASHGLHQDSWLLMVSLQSVQTGGWGASSNGEEKRGMGWGDWDYSLSSSRS